METRKPITPSQLAALLKPLKIRPKTHRINGKPDKGYLYSDFEDSFLRYIPISGSLHPLQTLSSTAFELKTEPLQEGTVTSAKIPEYPDPAWIVTPVTGKCRGEGQRDVFPDTEEGLI